jgi:hypothetical protein
MLHVYTPLSKSTQCRCTPLRMLTAASASVASFVKMGGSLPKSSPALWQLKACRWLISSCASRQRSRRPSAVCRAGQWLQDR